MADTVLNELVTWCSFEPRKGGDRQDYLTDLVKAVDVKAEGMPPRDFFKQVSKGAVAWFNECIDAMEGRYDLPEPAAVLMNGVDDDDDDLEPEDDEDEDEAEQHDPVKPGDEDVLQTHAEEATAESENEAKEAKLSKTETAKARAKLRRQKKGQKAREASPKGQAARYEAMDVSQKDSYGILMGTKAHDAIMMYEKGATVREVTEALGGVHRNILNVVASRGHKVERLADGLIIVTNSAKL